MPASLESPIRTTASVLLIEEYEALAMALTSALKKFAPQHRTRVVQSLSDAESAAVEIGPQLFILDFDPPHSNTIDFLNRMRAAHPDARVLVVASGTSAEFAAERYGPNAVQFVEKPFELADFGAAVQALLGPWTEVSTGDSRGTLRDLNVRDFVPLECVSGATAILKITASDQRVGEIHFLEGHICHASAPGLSGIDALHEIMRWENARGIEAPRAGNGPRTITGPWLPVFLEALKASRPPALESDTPAAPLIPPEEPVSPKLGKKIVVIDDTEMLAIFVKDSLAIADPSLQIFTALSGNEGIKETVAILPDLVLLDYSLPDLPGDQVCEQLLQNEATAKIPVVMMSGHVQQMTATGDRYPNVAATIAKPFISEALVELVTQILVRTSIPAPQPQETTITEPTESNAPKGATSPEAKPTRQGNGKKPARKGASSKSSKEMTAKVVPLPPAKPTPTAAETKSVTPKSETPAPEPSAVSPEIRPLETKPSKPAQSVSHPTKSAISNRGTVVLGWGMEVVSVQFTPRFQIGTLRVRPTASMSLTHLQESSVIGNGGPAGFELGKVELDSNGHIKTMRLRPTRAPAGSVLTRKGFDIRDVNLLNESACIQFTARSVAPMVMQLLATFKLIGVELSDRFEVAQLILQPEGNRVRITFDPNSRGNRGTEFETVGVQLDASARVVEFVLNPAAA